MPSPLCGFFSNLKIYRIYRRTAWGYHRNLLIDRRQARMKHAEWRKKSANLWFLCVEEIIAKQIVYFYEIHCKILGCSPPNGVFHTKIFFSNKNVLKYWDHLLANVLLCFFVHNVLIFMLKKMSIFEHAQRVEWRVARRGKNENKKMLTDRVIIIRIVK